MCFRNRASLLLLALACVSPPVDAVADIRDEPNYKVEVVKLECLDPKQAPAQTVEVVVSQYASNNASSKRSEDLDLTKQPAYAGRAMQFGGMSISVTTRGEIEIKARPSGKVLAAVELQRPDSVNMHDYLLARHVLPQLGGASAWKPLSVGETEHVFADAYYKLTVKVGQQSQIRPDYLLNRDVEIGEDVHLIPDKNSPVHWYYAAAADWSLLSGKGEAKRDFSILKYLDLDGNQMATVNFGLRIGVDDEAAASLKPRLLHKSPALQKLLAGNTADPNPGDPLHVFGDSGSRGGWIRALSESGIEHPVSVTLLPVRAVHVQLYVPNKSGGEFILDSDMIQRDLRAEELLKPLQEFRFSKEITAEQVDDLRIALMSAAGVKCRIHCAYETGDWSAPDPLQIANTWLLSTSHRDDLSPAESRLLKIVQEERVWAQANGYRVVSSREHELWAKLEKLAAKSPRDSIYATPDKQLKMVETAILYLLWIEFPERKNFGDDALRQKAGEYGSQPGRNMIRHNVSEQARDGSSPLRFLSHYPPYNNYKMAATKGVKNGERFATEEQKLKSIELFERPFRLGRQPIRRVYVEETRLTLPEIDNYVRGKFEEWTPSAFLLPHVEYERAWGLEVEELVIDPVLRIGNQTEAQRIFVSSLKTKLPGRVADATTGNGSPVVLVSYPQVRWTSSGGWQQRDEKIGDHWNAIGNHFVSLPLEVDARSRELLGRALSLSAEYFLKHRLQHQSDASTATTLNTAAKEKEWVERKAEPLNYTIRMDVFGGVRTLPYPHQYTDLVRIDPWMLEWERLKPGAKLSQVDISLAQDPRVFRVRMAPVPVGDDVWRAPDHVSWLIHKVTDDPKTFVAPTIEFVSTDGRRKAWRYNDATLHQQFPSLSIDLLPETLP